MALSDVTAEGIERALVEFDDSDSYVPFASRLTWTVGTFGETQMVRSFKRLPLGRVFQRVPEYLVAQPLKLLGVGPFRVGKAQDSQENARTHEVSGRI